MKRTGFNKVKITVVKATDMNEIHKDTDLGCKADISPVCSKFKEGQVFITDMQHIPEDFCPFAFADIARHIIMIGENGSYWWMNEKDNGKVIVCCTDGFRPVFFRVEQYHEL